MKRTGRLIELLSLLKSHKTYTVKELAQHFDVSHRTMLRDLHLLSESGVPLQASPGPGGGYSLIKTHHLSPLSFTVEEAVALIISYESFREYSDSPFEKETLSVITKLVAILPPDALEKVEQLRRTVQIDSPKRMVTTPFLRPLLHAALEQQCVAIQYDSLQRISHRVIQPGFLYAFHGYWYCRCYCFLRNKTVSLRVDRIKALCPEPDYPRKVVVPPAEADPPPGLPLLIRLSPKGCKMADWHHQLSNLIQIQDDGSGLIASTILPTDVEWISHVVMGLGQEAIVEQPPEVIAFLQAELAALSTQYPAPSS